MKATADLRSEHGGVARMLGIMDAMAARVRQGEHVDLDDLAQVIEFLRVFVDKCHHTKEEELLFPVFSAANMASPEPIVDILLEEHARGRATVARIQAALRGLELSDEAARAELADALTWYTALLRAHIEREEGYCFDVADRELPAAVQDELEEGYERIEREVVGGGVHAAFHALLGRLGEKYAEVGDSSFRVSSL
jgi:hemerythrin-like domain-containing protein